MELTILIPALNEEKTLGIVIDKAKKWIKKNCIDAEILVVNNGSTDRTKEIALELGARVIDFAPKGYGLALRKGIENAKGKYIIMGDADDSYNFLELNEMFEKLTSGYDIVIGNRYGGHMEKASMKFLHKYIGTPFISHLIRKNYGLKIKDINCGLRGGKKDKLLGLECESDGMEFASEMMIKATKKNMKIAEVPINFYKDKREGKGNLRTIRDGLRHLKVILKEKDWKDWKLSKYIISFVVIVVLCLVSLVLVTMFPNVNLEKNCREIAEKFYEDNKDFPELKMGINNLILDHYADSTSLGIIYSLDKENPLSSVLEAKWYKEENKLTTECLLDLINGEAQTNQNYVRYWHGYIILLKPLLMFFNINQIYIILATILIILIFLIIKQLWKIDKRAILAFLIGLYMITIYVVPLCFEYTWAFIITFIVSIIVLKKDNGDNKKIYPIFWITGILTCFFDFLTVELLTILLPLTFVLIKRNKEGKINNFKGIFKFIIISLVIWGIGYILMYFTKWIIASLVLGRNCVEEAMNRAMMRINGNAVYGESRNKLWVEAIQRNFNNLQPILYVKKKYIIYVLVPIITIIMLLINKYRNRNNNYLYGLLLIGLIPYIRYIIIVNHSCYHYFFTSRTQLVTAMAFILIVLNAFEKESRRKTKGNKRANKRIKKYL